MVAPAYNATVTARTDLTPALMFLTVRGDDEPRPFGPGQYITIGLVSGGKLVQRPYSVASSATRIDEGYELYIRLVPGGALTPLLFKTRSGDRIALKGPKGRFTLAPSDDRAHLFVATGCGLAPFMAMLRTMRDTGEHRRIVLIHGVSYVGELAYRLFLEDLDADPSHRFAYVPTVSRPAAPENAGWIHATGRAEAQVGPVCARYGLDPSNTVAYICGNPEMTATVRQLLTGRGWDPRDVHTEDYWPAAR